MAFKINLTDPYQEELDSVKGGAVLKSRRKKTKHF